jgi:radical SAM protein (TIGR01212 family)
MQAKRYRDFGTFLRERFPFKVQKISVDGGFTCPVRDGSKGWGGCSYCNNQTFTPDYCRALPTVSEQIEAGVRFFAHKYPAMKYLAYFQSYTNTYDGLDNLARKYEEALAFPNVAGLIVATRPDCITGEMLDYFASLARKTFVLIEYGVESTLDSTLERINRGHTFAESEDALRRTEAKGVLAGAHLILGLPGESREDMLRHADVLSQLPLATLKLHQLQLIRNTQMGHEYANHPERFSIPTVDEYVDLAVDFVERLHPSIAIERFGSQSPAELLLAPDWGIKNYILTAKIERRMDERNTCQGATNEYIKQT